MEKMMVKVLKDKNATIESKKLMLRELSWMGSDYSVPVIKDLAANAELKDEAEYALARLNNNPYSNFPHPVEGVGNDKLIRL